MCIYSKYKIVNILWFVIFLQAPDNFGNKIKCDGCWQGRGFVVFKSFENFERIEKSEDSNVAKDILADDDDGDCEGLGHIHCAAQC